ncbi:alpha-L-fucosidase [Variovorax sp. KBW07]|uniref:alpha-L-fucosidase n=1 Tax=Variovorax sp. KBW07 TaxID=2153358 RepID=UPI001628800E|nr:alpha-L-fucosidase [Variovorax sp. KBW07]
MKVTFSGSFTSVLGYTPATGEVIDGSVAKLTGGEDYKDVSVTTAGGAQGIVFVPRTHLVTGSDLTTPVLLEALVKRGGAGIAALDTIISAFGGIYFRYPNASNAVPQYGMFAYAAPYYDTSSTASTPVSTNAYDHLAMSYIPTADGGASLTVHINGCLQSDAIKIPKRSGVIENAVMFGNDVQVKNRGAKLVFAGVAVSTLTAAAEPQDFQLKAPECNPSAATLGLPGAMGEAIPLAQTVMVSGDLPGRIVEKSAYVIPSRSQYEWQAQGLTAFLHYGMNTFLNKEWSFGFEPASQFNPMDVDPDQWMKVLKRNGFKTAILVVKHHEGFVLFPSRYTRHSVKNSPWWTANADASGVNPKGNVVRQFVDAANANGMKVGFYVSPADGAQIKNAHGEAARQGEERFANGSAKKSVTIPTLVDGDNRTPIAARTTTLQADDYNAYFMNVLYELLTEYGPVGEVWFDGANPYGAEYAQNYQVKDWYALVRQLQPETVIAVNGPDVRWVGSESGAFRASEWSTHAFRGDPTELLKSDNLSGDSTDRALGSARAIGGADLPPEKKPTYLSWWPAEADVSIRPGWFWSAGQDSQVKSASKLFSLYEDSVGRNAVLLLNVPPNRSGKLADPDVIELDKFGSMVRAAYTNNLLTAKQSSPALDALVDGNPESDWTPGEKKTTGSVDLTSPAAITFNRVVLQENILKGQRIESVSVSARQADGTWKEVATAGAIGYKRIMPLDTTTTTAVRVTIKSARAQPYLGSVELYLNP